MINSDKLLTIKESALYLKVHWQTIRNYIKNGDITAIKFGHNVRIHQSELDRFVANQESINEESTIELRYKCNDLITIENILIKIGSKLLYHGELTDHWYVPNEINDSIHTNIWFETGKGQGVRIREQRIGYKDNIITTLGVKRLAEPYKKETTLEKEIDVDDYENTHSLLTLMSFKEFVTIVKTRKLYSYEQFEITIDMIRDFESGLEIKTTSKISGLEAKDRIRKFINSSGLDKYLEETEMSVSSLAMENFAKY